MQNQPAPSASGYPTGNGPTRKKKKMNCWPRTKPKGERGFCEGCLFALCCCWICDVCFD